jgi:hypothetical protein
MVSKNQYIQEFVSKSSRVFKEGLISIYTGAKAKTHNTPKAVLKQFQLELQNTPNWNNVLIEKEYERFLSSTRCSWLGDLILAVFKSFGKDMLLSLNDDIDDEIKTMINIDVPSPRSFIHLCYVEMSRRFWKEPQLFYDQVPKALRAENDTKIDFIIQDSIFVVVRNTFPLDVVIQRLMKKNDENILRTNNSSRSYNSVHNLCKHTDIDVDNLCKHTEPDHNDQKEEMTNADHKEIKAVQEEEIMTTDHKEQNADHKEEITTADQKEEIITTDHKEQNADQKEEITTADQKEENNDQVEEITDNHNEPTAEHVEEKDQEDREEEEEEDAHDEEENVLEKNDQEEENTDREEEDDDHDEEEDVPEKNDYDQEENDYDQEEEYDDREENDNDEEQKADQEQHDKGIKYVSDHINSDRYVEVNNASEENSHENNNVHIIHIRTGAEKKKRLMNHGTDSDSDDDCEIQTNATLSKHIVPSQITYSMSSKIDPQNHQQVRHENDHVDPKNIGYDRHEHDIIPKPDLNGYQNDLPKRGRNGDDTACDTLNHKETILRHDHKNHQDEADFDAQIRKSIKAVYFNDKQRKNEEKIKKILGIDVSYPEYRKSKPSSIRRKLIIDDINKRRALLASQPHEQATS